jgi:hypothetical protein
MTRRLLSAAVVAVVFVLASAPAGAQEEPVVRVLLGPAVTRTYSDLNGEEPAPNDQLGTLPEVTPRHCRPSNYTWCDLIPFDVAAPRLGRDEDFFVSVLIDWQYASIRQAGKEIATNDLKAWIFDDGQVTHTQGSASPGYTPLTSDLSNGAPKLLRLFSPTLGRYNLVVYNNGNAPANGMSFRVTWHVDIVSRAEMAKSWRRTTQGPSARKGPTDPLRAGAVPGSTIATLEVQDLGTEIPGVADASGSGAGIGSVGLFAAIPAMSLLLLIAGRRRRQSR